MLGRKDNKGAQGTPDPELGTSMGLGPGPEGGRGPAGKRDRKKTAVLERWPHSEAEDTGGLTRLNHGRIGQDAAKDSQEDKEEETE